MEEEFGLLEAANTFDEKTAAAVEIALVLSVASAEVPSKRDELAYASLEESRLLRVGQEVSSRVRSRFGC